MGLGDDTTAARRLRLLQAELRQPTQQRDPGARRTPTTTSSAPLRLGIVDHIKSSVDEVIHHTRAAAPDAGPLPTEAGSIYSWMRQHTAQSDDGYQDALDQVVYRQGLEHAILMGDHKVVRPHPCPECGCYGLFWQPARNAAVCVNHLCTDDDGVSHAWPLKRLAYEHIARKKMLKIRAT